MYDISVLSVIPFELCPSDYRGLKKQISAICDAGTPKKSPELPQNTNETGATSTLPLQQGSQAPAPHNDVLALSTAPGVKSESQPQFDDTNVADQLDQRLPEDAGRTVSSRPPHGRKLSFPSLKSLKSRKSSKALREENVTKGVFCCCPAR